MKITFSTDLTAADTERRIIAGRIVTWGETGHTSAGPTRFAAGAIELADDIRLLREHDHTSPLGRSVSVREHEQGIDARFRIAATTAGTDALVEASEQLRDGLSVGVQVLESETDDEGTLVVSAARLDEVSLVAHPAIDSARVERVAASEPQPEAETERNEMNPDENTVEVEEVEAESVEASRPRTVTATRKAVAPFTSPEEYVIASIEAQRGDRDAVARITAAVAQEGLADNPGVVPTPIVGDLISKVYGERPIINSARRLPMPQSGKVFERPMIAQHTTVGKQSAEFVELASQAMSITSLSVTKATYGGAVEVSFQNRDWTDPAIMGIVIADLVREYAEQTEAAAAIALTTGATGSQDLTAAGDAAAVTSAIYDGAEKVHTAAGELPDTLYVSPDQWARLGKLADTTNRPLFPSLAPSNANGQMNAGSFASNPFGLRLVVSNHFGGPTMILGVSRLLEHFEQVGGQLSATNVSTLSTTVAYYGYAAELVTIGGGFVKMTLA